MDNYDYVIIYIGLVSYIAAIVQGVTTFGDAIVVHILWRVGVIVAPDIMASTPFGDNHLLAVTVLLTVRSVGVQIIFCARSMDFLCWKLLRILLPVQAACVVVGGLVLSHFEHSESLGPVLGAIFGIAAVAFGALSVRQVVNNRRKGVVARKDYREFDINHSVQGWIALAGVGSGLMQGVVSIGGPPMMIAAVALDLPQPVLRGVFPFTSLFGFGIRLVECIVFGWIDARSWMLFVAISIGAVAGLQVGIEISGNLPHDVFIVCVCWLMLFAAIAIAQTSGAVVFGSFGLCAVTFVGLYFWSKKHQNRHDAAAAAATAASAASAASRVEEASANDDDRPFGFGSFAVPCTPSVPAIGIFPHVAASGGAVNTAAS
jgi:uncharacterized membrane protein YfcA